MPLLFPFMPSPVYDDDQQAPIDCWNLMPSKGAHSCTASFHTSICIPDHDAKKIPDGFTIARESFSSCLETVSLLNVTCLLVDPQHRGRHFMKTFLQSPMYQDVDPDQMDMTSGLRELWNAATDPGRPDVAAPQPDVSTSARNWLQQNVRAVLLLLFI